jgi:hypothetical protein
MANEAEHKSAASLARRKEDLVTRGALFRSELSNAQQAVKTHLRAESLIQSAISHVAMAVFAAFRNRSSAGVGLPAILPLLVGGISALSRKSLLKPLLKIGLVLAGVGAIIGMLARKKKTVDMRRNARSAG